MPTFDVTIQGHCYHVEIPDPGASPLRVIVDGEPFDVQLSGGPAPVVTQRAAAPAPVHLPPPRQVAVARPAEAGDVELGHDITAPMPGTVLSIPIAMGEQIEAGQVVCVLEAMKMKNPIRAGIGGTITQIAIEPGENVTYGQLLVRLA